MNLKTHTRPYLNNTQPSISINTLHKLKNNKLFGLVGSKYNTIVQSCISLNSPYLKKINTRTETFNKQKILTLTSLYYKTGPFKNCPVGDLKPNLQHNNLLNKFTHSYFLPKQLLFETSKPLLLYVQPNTVVSPNEHFDYNTYTPNFQHKFSNIWISIKKTNGVTSLKPLIKVKSLSTACPLFFIKNTPLSSLTNYRLKFTPYLKYPTVFKKTSPSNVSTFPQHTTLPTFYKRNPLFKYFHVLLTRVFLTCQASIQKFFVKISTSCQPSNFLVKSRSFNKLVLNNTGLFISNNYKFYSNLFLKSTYKPLFKMRKYSYSFMKPNQVKALVLKRKASLVLYKLVSNLSTGINYNKYNNLRTLLLLRRGTTCRLRITNNIDTPATYFTEVKLPRVKFKPGYQRLWRESRTALKDLLGVKFLYQQKLTKYISHFIRKSAKFNSVGYELTLDKLVIYSKILPDYNTFKLFFLKNIIFINGKAPTTHNITCVVNDFIQLVVLKWYYIFYRWLLNWSILRSRKVKRLVYRKGLSSRYTIMKSRKQRSYSIPDWIFSSKYDFSDVKPFLEVDYFSLSFFLLYEPYTTYYYTPTKFQEPHISMYKLYNWKYIT